MALLALSMAQIVLLLFGSVIFYIAANVTYNLWLHPLRKYPGPLLWRASRLTYSYHNIIGTLPFDILTLHQKYGEVVRVAPDELAFANPQAWQDVHGHRTKGHESFEKRQQFYQAVEDAETHIVSAGREEHAVLRRTLASGFSDKSLREQEPLVKKYIDLLLQRLHENCEDGTKALDMTSWYNWTTFDIIGDLAFGEPFKCLAMQQYHPWVWMIFQMARMGTVLQALGQFPTLRKFLLKMVPKALLEESETYHTMTKEMLLRRMAVKERPDLINGMLLKKDQYGFSLDKLVANSTMLIIGGSETTATLLVGCTYFLVMNPDTLKKATDEVRTRFQTEDEINFTTVNELTYMIACLDEALRCYSPVPIGLPRVAPKGGAEVCGHYVPEGTTCSVFHWALYHNEKLWKDPFGFHPERHLDDPEFAQDQKEALQPFQIGPRACIGRNLAYVEMRTILARVLFNFDLRIAEESRNWIDQKIYNLWKKGPMYVFLSPVQRR